MFELRIIIASTRPGRKGPIVAEWISAIAKADKNFNTEVFDLQEINLPFMDEPNHPRLKQYTKEHTWKWSGMVGAADAFIFVTPEYNYGFPATLKNAIDFLQHEWAFKPVAFVSYGGIGAGTRCIQMLKQVLTSLQMMPLFEAVNIPFFTKYINSQNKFEATEEQNKVAATVMASLLKWTIAMQSLRPDKAASPASE